MSQGEDTFELHCKIYKISPEREVRFDEKRRWRFDFAFPKVKLAVEIEGGTWQTGRHQRPIGFLKDLQKYNEAVLAGWRVLRFTTDQVNSGEAIDVVCKALA